LLINAGLTVQLVSPLGKYFQHLHHHLLGDE